MLDSLRGVSILEVGAMTPGKYCGFLLVGWGARSMRIERTGGDGGISNEDLQLNRGKQSKVLNLRDPSDRGTLLDLAREADVLIECY
ncbi:MAG: CoA transferase, partial [Alphaproteobacteria bacterium]